MPRPEPTGATRTGESRRPETLVVGGGIAGLAIARRLARAGRRVTILEASPTVGGQLAAQRLGGVDLDAGAESFASRGAAVIELLAELGLAGDVVAPTPAPAWLMRPGGAVPLPAASVLGIPADPLSRDVVRAVGPVAALRARADALLPRGVGARETTVGGLVAARMGRRMRDALVAPVVRGVYSREADELPLAVASPTLPRLVREHGSLAAAVRGMRAAAPAGSLVAGLRGGMFRLAEALAAECRLLGVTIETGVVVEEVAPDVVVVAGVRRPGEVVLAAPRPGLLPDRTITLVTLLLDAPELDGAPRGSGLLVAAGSGVTARALTHLTAKWDWVAEALPGRHAVRLSYDATPVDPVATARTDVARLFGVELPEPEDATVRLWARPARDAEGFAGSRVGEPVAGTGLAAVLGQVDEATALLLDEDSRPHEGAGRMGS